VAFELLLQQRRVPAAGPVGEPVEPVGEDPPTPPHPVADQPGEPVDPVADLVRESAPEVDPLGLRIAELVDAGRTEGRPVGRRTVARELGVTEYRAGQLLARTNSNGNGGRRP